MSIIDNGVGEGLAIGFEKGVSNFFNAMGAVRRLKLTAEKNNIDAKKAQLDLKKMELEMDPDTIAANKELLQGKIKAQKSLDQFNIMRATREARKVKQDALQHKMALDFFQTATQDPTMRQNVGISGSGKMTYRPPSNATINYNRGSGAPTVAPAAKPMASREMPAGMPAATDYVNGTTIEDDSGQKYQVKNGQWVMA